MHRFVLVTVHCVLPPQSWEPGSECEPGATFPSAESATLVGLVFLKDEGMGDTDWTSWFTDISSSSRILHKWTSDGSGWGLRGVMGVSWRQECEYARCWWVEGSGGNFVCPHLPWSGRSDLGLRPLALPRPMGSNPDLSELGFLSTSLRKSLASWISLSSSHICPQPGRKVWVQDHTVTEVGEVRPMSWGLVHGALSLCSCSDLGRRDLTPFILSRRYMCTWLTIIASPPAHEADTQGRNGGSEGFTVFLKVSWLMAEPLPSSTE